MPSRRDIEQYRPMGSSASTYGTSAHEFNADIAPYGSSAGDRKRSYEDMSRSGTSMGSGMSRGGVSGGGGGGSSSGGGAPIVQEVEKNVSEVRSDLLAMVQSMVEDQRAKVEKLRLDVTCNGSV